MQTTLSELGIVSSRVALLLRSAEIKPVFHGFVGGSPPPRCGNGWYRFRCVSCYHYSLFLYIDTIALRYLCAYSTCGAYSRWWEGGVGRVEWGRVRWELVVSLVVSGLRNVRRWMSL